MRIPGNLGVPWKLAHESSPSAGTVLERVMRGGIAEGDVGCIEGIEGTRGGAWGVTNYCPGTGKRLMG